MHSNLTVILFEPASGTVSRAASHAFDLRAYGLDVQVCRDQDELADYAAGRPGVCFVLGGSLAQSCAAATRLRQRSQDIGILALVPPIDESVLISVFHSGADAYCPADASVALLVAALAAIRRRVSPGKPKAEAALGPQWALTDRAWVLVGAAGGRVPLTTGERAFLCALFDAPGRRASHAELIAALARAYGEPDPAQVRTRLGILVTRLRRKCLDHDEVLPLKSVHGWGYMFAGAVSA